MLLSVQVVASSPLPLFEKEGLGEIFFFHAVPLSQKIADLLRSTIPTPQSNPP
jgi:hypothetical protein